MKWQTQMWLKFSPSKWHTALCSVLLKRATVAFWPRPFIDRTAINPWLGRTWKKIKDLMGNAELNPTPPCHGHGWMNWIQHSRTPNPVNDCCGASACWENRIILNNMTCCSSSSSSRFVLLQAAAKAHGFWVGVLVHQTWAVLLVLQKRSRIFTFYLVINFFFYF